MKTKILTLLGAGNEEQIDLIIEMVTQTILNELKGMGAPQQELPAELEYIAIEMAIARYNRIGGEGMAKESEEGRSIEYAEDILSAHRAELSAWAKANGGTSTEGLVRFI